MSAPPQNPAQLYLADAIRERKLNMAELSREIGKNATYIQQHLTYGKPPYLTERNRLRITQLLGLDESRLRPPGDNGRIVAIDTDEIDSSGADEEILDLAWRHRAGRLKPGEVVERDVRGGLGIGGLADEVKVDGASVDRPSASWVFPLGFLRSELRATEKEVDIIAVDGDSMMPTLLPGDRVMVHRAHRAPSPDGVFAINDGIGVSVKRLQIVRGSDPLQVRIISDNERHPIDTMMAADLTVIGRVICKVSRL